MKRVRSRGLTLESLDDEREESEKDRRVEKVLREDKEESGVPECVDEERSDAEGLHDHFELASVLLLNLLYYSNKTPKNTSHMAGVL